MKIKIKITSMVYALFSLIFLVSSCSSKTEKDELLVGTWRGVKRESRDGETGENVTLDGKPYFHDFLIEFRDNGIFHDLMNKSNLKYSFEDESFLKIGSSLYVVEKLTSDSLVLLEYTRDYPDDPLVFRTYYQKVQK